jgi:hypothetical protein
MPVTLVVKYAARLSQVDQNLFWERIFLNPYIFEGAEGF